MVISRSEVDEVLLQVQSWPAQVRLLLARRVLETLSPGELNTSTELKGPPAQQVLGLWNLGGTAPTDEKCQEILVEELQRKHSA